MSYEIIVNPPAQYVIEYSNQRGPQGPPGADGTGGGGGATTDASLLTSGTLADARLSSNVALENSANVFTTNQEFAGTPNVSFPQRVGNLQIVEGGLVQSGNGDTTGSGSPRQIQRFNSTQTDSDSVGWGFIYTQAGSFTSSDAVTYRDHVYVLGMNVLGSQQRIDNDKPYLAFQFESKFTNSDSTKFGSEWHLEHKAPGAAAPTLRAMTMFLPFDLTQRGLGGFATQVDTVAFYDQLSTIRMQWNLHNNDLLMYACRQYFNTNNAAPLLQRNAANNGYVNLPWVDNLDRIRVSSQLFAQAGSTGANSNAAHTIQATSWAGNNNIALAISGATDSVSGSKVYSGLQAVASINGLWDCRITNTFAGGESAWDAVVNGSGGKAKSIYRTTSQGGFDIGYDGVTDTFIISRAQGLGIDSLTYVTMSRASNVPANSVWTHRGSVVVVGTFTAQNKITAPASTTARASLNLAHGVAPTSPVDGDIWTTSAGTFVRVNGATVGIQKAITSGTAAPSGGVDGDIYLQYT